MNFMSSLFKNVDQSVFFKSWEVNCKKAEF